MMARRGVLGLLAGGAAVVLAGCGVLWPKKSYRFRMTVEVETPQGPRTGSGVLEVTAQKMPELTSEAAAGSAAVKGQAVVVDLPGGPVFLLLKPAGSGQPLHATVTRALVPDAPLHPVENFVRAVGELGSWSASAKAELPRADWPLMVRFGDIADPKSVEQVDPAAIGVKRIMVETTSDAVSTGIEQRLGWLPSQRGSFVRRLSVPDPTNPPIAAILNKSDFSSEIGK